MCLVTQSCLTLCDPKDCSPLSSSVNGNSPDKNTEVGCRTLLQGKFPIQGSNPCLPHCRQILYHLSHQGSPRILEWVAYLFSRGSSLPGNWTGVSCIAGEFFTSWATGKSMVVVIFHCIYVFWFLMHKIKYSKVFNGYYISSSVPNTSQSLP